MTRRVLVPGLVVVLFVLSGCARPHRASDIHLTKTFSATPGKLVRLNTSSLDIVVNVKETSEIALTIDMEVSASSSRKAASWIERNTPKITDSSTQLSVSNPGRGRIEFMVGFFSAKGRLTVSLPPSCRLEIGTASGDVEISGDVALSSKVKIDTASGDVVVRGGVSDLVVDTASGEVRVLGGILASLQADTASGDVRIETPCKSATVDTASGEVRLEQMLGSCSVDTTSGDVVVAWDLISGGDRVLFGSTSGDVTLRFPNDALLSGRLETTSGDIRSRFSGTKERHELILDGSGNTVEVKVSTTSGSISLQRGGGQFGGK